MRNLDQVNQAKLTQRPAYIQGVKSYMVLVIDVGNTNIVMGVYAEKNLRAKWRLETDINATPDEFNRLASSLLSANSIGPEKIDKIVISSVVPTVAGNLDFFCSKTIGCAPKWIDAVSAKKLNIQIWYDNLKELGTDRIVNAVAAYNKYKTGLIVIDLGTATTIDAVSEKGVYLGGSISPGLVTSSEALFMQSSMLPRVKIDLPPKKVIGKNTIDSMLSGIIYGYAGLVDGITRRMIKETKMNPLVIATGGLALLIYKVSETIKIVEPDLTLEGLRLFGSL